MTTPGPLGRRLLRLVARVAAGVARPRESGRGSPGSPSRPTPPHGQVTAATGADGDVVVSYAPRADGHPDPGEVVWAWVPYEDDPAQGKDRPVLVIGRTGDGPDAALAALMLTSKDHDRDAAQEAHWGRHWMDVGSGAWDVRRRPSEVRLDRLLRLAPDGVRREGAALDRPVFDAVVAAFRARRGQ